MLLDGVLIPVYEQSLKKVEEEVGGGGGGHSGVIAAFDIVINKMVNSNSSKQIWASNF